MTRILVGTLFLMALSATEARLGRTQAPGPVEFVGTTPCGDAPRAFLGGMKGGAPCHAITWRLALNTAAGRSGTWTLAASYGIPPASNPNQMIDGPKVSLTGTLDVASGTALGPGSTVYRLTAEGPRRSLSFVRVNDDLVHLLAENNALMVGTAGWSYTLNRSGRAEKAGDPSMASDMSYTISPRATGSSVFGLFEGRTPCSGIARELTITPGPGCLKVKWRVTLYQSPDSAQPTTYKVEGTLHRKAARTGKWRIARGTATNPGAVIYLLEATADEGALPLLKGDDNVLFFLNQQQLPLVGSRDFGYTLNRVMPDR